MHMSENKKYKCVLCDGESYGYGNNPEPIKPYDAGRCCEACNTMMVIPARMAAILNHGQGVDIRRPR